MIDNATFLDRQCRIISDTEQSNAPHSENEPSLSIKDLSQEAAFVLLGEPGMGKTSSLEAIAKHLGGQYISAHDFVLEDASTLRPDQFYCIDALDEARVSADSTAFKEIRKLIYQAKLSHFCISCRIADWLKTDTKEIQHLAPNKHLKVAELLPLSEGETNSLLLATGVNNPSNFIEQAEQLGFADMLGNPQSIKMLAAAVKQNDQQWPKKRSEAYELACISLLHEHNDHHLQSETGTLVSDESLLDTSGWLCSLLLLSNRNAISMTNLGLKKNTHSILRLESVIHDFPNNASDLAKITLKRRLFHKTGGIDYYSPIHRTVAEYLAARYLSKLISQKALLAERISTLLLASPKHLVSNLRGLAGWLAAISSPISQKIFEADPVAVITYGDLNLLSTIDKQNLIKYLSINPSFQYSYLLSQSEGYAPLVQADMRKHINGWLNELVTNDSKFNSLSQTHTVHLLLYAIEKLNKDITWEPSLKALVRCNETNHIFQRSALNGLWKHSIDPAETYLEILNEINCGKISDNDNALKGKILHKLYPRYLTPNQLLKCFTPPDQENFDIYTTFWLEDLSAATIDDLLPEWMDSLERAINDNFFERGDDGLYYNQRIEFSSLILRSIEIFGVAQTPQRLAKWLSWCVFDNHTPFETLDSEQYQRLVKWKELHYTKVQDVIAYHLRAMTPPHMAGYKISYNTLPKMGLFWLNQAKLLSHEEGVTDYSKRSAVALDNAVCYWQKNTKPEISLEDIEEIALLNSELKELFDSKKKCDIENNWKRKSWLAQKERHKQQEIQEQSRESRLQLLLEQLDNIRSGENLQFLYYAAWAELPNHYINNPEHDWILQNLEQYPELDKAVNQGYRACLKKLTKLDIVKSYKAIEKKQRLLIELPAYIGAAKLFEENPCELLGLNDEILEAVSTLFLSASFLSTSIDRLPEWLLFLSEKRGNLVTKLWIGVHQDWLKQKPKKKEESKLPLLNTLSDEPRLTKLAKKILPETLKHWPLKVSNKNLFGFTDLLIAMIHHCPVELPDLIESRLQKKSISAVQRAHLIMAGLWIAPNNFKNRLKPYIEKKITSHNPYLSFIAYAYRYGVRGKNSLALPSWEVEIIALLFQLLAPSFSPEFFGRIIWAPSPDDDGREFLRVLEDQLLNNLSVSGLQVIKDLGANKALIQWESHFDKLLSRYATALAEKNFITPTPLQVAGVLQNKSPASHADLMALAIESLDHIQREIKNSPTDLIHRFWSVNSNAQKAIPPHRPETECRNVIADRLITHLQNYGVTLLPELLHGGGNQSDIGLLVQILGQADLLLPIEVKGDWNKSKGGRDLWHAAKNQLYDKYVTDPRCGALGLYLVLWMGDRKKGNNHHTDEAYAHPNYPSIKTAEQLLEALTEEASGLLGEASNQVKIVVLDLSIN